MKRLTLFVVLMVCLVLLSGCTPPMRSVYLKGAVFVEYHQNRMGAESDYILFFFYKKGVYTVSFSYTPGKSSLRQAKLPEDFSIEIADRGDYKIEQYILPDNLRITIQTDDTSEAQDFQ